MNKNFLWLSFALLLHCQRQTTSPSRIPDAPTLLPAPADSLTDEHGIDAIPEMDAILVEWIPGPDYEGYALYRRSAQEATYQRLKKFSAADSSYTDTRVALNVRYFYYLTAQNDLENWSPPSDTVSYMLIEKATNLFYLQPDNQFQWHQQHIPPRRYILKLFNAMSGQLVWMRRIEPLYHQDEQSVSYNDDGSAGDQTLASGTEYTWRIDSVGPSAGSGSESMWASISVP